MAKTLTLRGKAWIFGDNLDVDWEIVSFEEIHGLHEQHIPADYEHLGPLCMKNVDPDFAKKVQKGDIIVAGESMGYGHDHDTACIAIRGAGVSAVLCESSGAYFMRNSLDHGLPVIEIEGIKKMVQQGDDLEVDLGAGEVTNLSTGAKATFIPLPDFLIETVADGGTMPRLKRLIAEGKVKI